MRSLLSKIEFSTVHGFGDYKVTIIDRARGEYNYFTWPSSEVLAEYVHSNPKPGCNVLELSCGTGLPGLVAAKCSANVTLTDHDKVDQAYWSKVSEVNNVSVIVKQLKWCDNTQLTPIDLVLASDVLYETKDFEAVLATIASILGQNKGSKCWMSYQVRSATRSIVDLLEHWGLSARCLLKSEVGHDIMIYELTLDS